MAIRAPDGANNNNDDNNDNGNDNDNHSVDLFLYTRWFN